MFSKEFIKKRNTDEPQEYPFETHNFPSIIKEDEPILNVPSATPYPTRDSVEQSVFVPTAIPPPKPPKPYIQAQKVH
jgi:hypothetical protein